MASILITGAAGFIGFQLAQRAVALGHTVVGIDPQQWQDPRPWQLAKIQEFASQWTFHPTSIFDAPTSVWEAEYDAVFSLAATPNIRYVEAHPELAHRNNIEAFEFSLAQLQQGAQKRIVLASSSSVYGSSIYDGTNTGASQESDTLEPISLYANQKVQSEHILQQQSGADKTISARLFSVYGPSIRPDLVLYKLLERAHDHQPMTIFGDGTQRRDWTYIDDVVDALLLLGLSEKLDDSPHDVFNVGSGQPHQLNEMIATVQQETGESINCKYSSPNDNEVEVTFANIERLTALGWRPQHNLTSGIRATSQWFNREVSRQAR